MKSLNFIILFRYLIINMHLKLQIFINQTTKIHFLIFNNKYAFKTYFLLNVSLFNMIH